MRKLFGAVLFLAITACFLSSSRIVRNDATVATVGGRFITVASLDSTMKQIEKNTDSPVPLDSLKLAALDSLIAHRLIDIRADSVRRSVENDQEFRLKMLDDINQSVFKVLFDKQIATRIKIDSSEIIQNYNDNRSTYIEPEKIKARHILIRRPKPDTAGVSNEKKRQKLLDESDKFARERADAVMKKVLAGENWDTLAATYSEDNNNAKKGGDLGYFTHGRMGREFDSLAFNSTPGDIVGPVSTQFGYDIIKVDDHQQPKPMVLNDDLFNQINADLIGVREKEYSNAFLDSLKGKAAYLYNEEEIAKADSLVNSAAWIMIVNSTDTILGSTFKESLPKYKRWKKVDSLSVENKKELLDLMAPMHLLRSATKTLGYMNAPEIVNAVKDAINSETTLRMSHYLRDIQYEPGEEEVAAYYEAHKDDYIEKRPLLVHHILFQDSALAEVIRDSIVAGADFAEMAKRYYPGDPEIREVLYNLDYIGPEEMGTAFYSVAETLQVGGVSHPVQTVWGYHLIKLVNRKQDRTLAQVRPGIRQKLRDARDAVKTARIVADWRKEALININEKVLANYRPAEKKVTRIEANAPPQKGK